MEEQVEGGSLGSGTSGQSVGLFGHASQNSLDECSQRKSQWNLAEEDDLKSLFRNPEHFAKAFVKLDTLRRTNVMCDVTLMAGKLEIPAHRMILASCSPYFHAMFTSFEQRDKDQVHIQGVHPIALKMLVGYIYTGEIKITEETVQVLLPGANLLQLPDVNEACSEFLKEQLHPSNCLGIRDFAHLHGCVDLMNAADLFIHLHFAEVVQGDEYLSPNSQQMLIEPSRLFSSTHQDDTPPEILNKIFQDLTVPDLLSCSVVCQNWKQAARDILKQKRECYVYIRNVQDVPALNLALASTNLMEMANGLHINLQPRNTNSASDDDVDDDKTWKESFISSPDQTIPQSQKTRRTLKKEIAKLSHLFLSTGWKYLTLQLGDPEGWEDRLSKIDALLFQEIISSTSESLEKLTVGKDEDCFFIHGCQEEFTKLQVLHDSSAYDQYQQKFKKSTEQFVVKWTPNLIEITGSAWNVFDEVDPFVMIRVKNLDFDNYDSADQAPEICRSISGLYGLNLHNVGMLPDDYQFSMVLKSLDSLENLSMETREFNKLCTTKREVKFGKLRELNLLAGGTVSLGVELALWNELRKLCPKLEKVTFSAWVEPEEEEEFPAPRPYLDEQYQLPLEIKFDSWDSGRYTERHFHFLNKVYANITKVSIEEWDGEDYDLSIIFLEFKSLKYLEFSDALSRYVDALLCGINKEEVKLLSERGRSDDGTAAIPSIVPIRPCIFNAKNLTEVKVGRYEPDINQSWLCELTENVPVRHVRNLKVTIDYLGRYHVPPPPPVFTTLFPSTMISNSAA